MFTSCEVPGFTFRGVSIAGVYTSIHVPQLAALFDAGMCHRSVAGVKTLFLTHGHVDHIGSLLTLLGMRALGKGTPPLQVVLPQELVRAVETLLDSVTEFHRSPLKVDLVPLAPGEEMKHHRFVVKAVKADHPVPALGFLFKQRVQKLLNAYRHLTGREIAQRRERGEALFEEVERLEFAFLTDTSIRVLDDNPELMTARVLALECTHLDERKAPHAVAEGGHIHLDHLLERQEAFKNDHIILTHISQKYRSAEVPEILNRRCPAPFHAKLIPFVKSPHAKSPSSRREELASQGEELASQGEELASQSEELASPTSAEFRKLTER